MADEESKFTTSNVLENEVVKESDFTYAFEGLINNVSKATQMMLEATQDFVISSRKSALIQPYSGMNVKINPFYGVCFSTSQCFGCLKSQTVPYGFEESANGRVDILMVKGEFATFDNVQRAFNDPDTDTKTYQYVNIKKDLDCVFKIKQGTEGSSTAPEVDDGYVKLCEIVIHANTSTILESDIKNITSDISGLDNEEWTTDKQATYNIGYITDVNERFREAHNEDGSHADNSIGINALKHSTASTDANGNTLPIAQAISLEGTDYASTTSIGNMLATICTKITDIFSKYLKYGDFNFNGEIAISSLVENNLLSNALKIGAAGDGSAYLKIGDNIVLTITTDGKLQTKGYTATASNDLITKSVSDAISESLSALETRVNNIEKTSDVTVYSNSVISAGDNGRYNFDSTPIYCATTENVELSGTQTIDGLSGLTDGIYVLVRKQNDSKENGIYQYSSSSSWTRVTAYSSPASLSGKLWHISNGTTMGGKILYIPKVNFVDSSAFGSDDIEFLEYFGSISSKANRLVMRDSSGNISVGKVNGYNLTEACAKAIDTSIEASTESVNLPTSKAVEDRINIHSGIDKVGTVTGIKMNNSDKTVGTDGVVDLGTVITSYTDTKNTAGATDTSSKLFLIGATAQTANPQTYSQDTAFVGTNGHLYSNSKQVVNLSDSQALTNKTYNGYTLAAACAKGVDTTASNTSTNVPTTGMAISCGNAGAICTTAAATQAKVVSLSGFALYDGVTVKVMFKNGNSAAAPTLNVNGTGTFGIRVVKGGTLSVPSIHTGYWRGADSSSTEMWQPFTVLEFIYYQADQKWVIIGNPTVESYYSSTSSYEVKADGLIEQVGYYSGSISDDGRVNIPFPVIANNNMCVNITAYDTDNTGEKSYFIEGVSSSPDGATILLKTGFRFCNASNAIAGFYWSANGF